MTTTTLAPSPANVRLGHLLERRAQLHPERVALVFDEHSWTYGDLHSWVVRTARQLRRHGVERGGIVAYAGGSRPEVFVLMYAAARIGAVFMPVNGAATESEMAFLIADAGVDALVADAECCAKLSGPGSVRPRLRLCLDEQPPPGWAALADADGAADPPDEAPAPVTEHDLAVIAYTSGTSGRPKGVLLSHGSLFWSCLNGLLALDLTQDDVTLITTPVFHIAVLSGIGAYTWAKGGTVVLEPSFTPDRFLETVRRHRVTLTFAVPAMLGLVARHPGFAGADLSSLRWILSGGASAPTAISAAFHERGIPVLSSYGLTETGAGVTYRDPADGVGATGEAGRPAPYAEIRVVDAANRPLPPGCPGEVVVRSPSLMSGYHNLPHETAAAFDSGGWFHGGDRGYLDDRGRLVLVGRIKDTIVTGGENVDPAEVEEALRAHPGVADVAVLGTPDPVWGEIVTAVVVPEAGTRPTLENIRDFLAPVLSRHKIPRRLKLRDRLPRTATGKLQRARLREETSGGGP